MLPALPCDLDDRYTLTAELGRGSHAIVYRAFDRHLDREVAVKVLREELLGSDVSERFQREIRLTSRLEHPNIAHVYGTGEFMGTPYFVIALARGTTLGERLKHEHQLPVSEALAIARQVASALQHAHAAGIIHRDVKPENILLTPDGALLSDFGVARALEQVPGTLATSTGTAVGTLLYMSPEQLCAEKDVDARSDQYALALVIYEMLAGVPAHIAANAEGLRGLRIVGQQAPLRTHRPTVPEPVEGAVHQALAPAPADRFTSMTAFISALDGGQTSASIRISAAKPATRPVSAAVPMRQWIAGTMAVAVVAMAGVLGANRLRPTATQVVSFAPGMAFNFIISANGDTAVAAALANELRLWSPEIGVNAATPPATAPAVVLETRVTPLPGGVHAAVRLRPSGAPSSTVTRLVQVTLPAAGASRADSIRVLAARVLLASQVSPDSIELPDAVVEHPIAALRRYGDGWVALLAGDLSKAEQAFADAARTRSLPQATLWQATVASWRQPRSPGAWRDAASAAQASSSVLSRRDSLLAEALRHRANDRMPESCDAYTRATQVSGGSFAAWYGLGECLQHDSIVVIDPKSPTGARFRSGYWSAAHAYRKAVERMPSAQIVVLFSRLPRVTSAVTGETRTGAKRVATGESYIGMPGIDADSVTIFPIATRRMADGRQSIVPASYQRAVLRGRQQLLALTRLLADRAPQNIMSLLGLARALEYAGRLNTSDGGASALSVLAAASPLVRSRKDSLDVGISMIRVQLRLGAFSGARDAGNGLLTLAKTADAAEADLLAPLALLLGRSALAESLYARSILGADGEPAVLPESAALDIAAYTLAVASGRCDALPELRSAAASAVTTYVAGAERDDAIIRWLGPGDWMRLWCADAPMPAGVPPGDAALRPYGMLRARKQGAVIVALRQMARERDGAAASAIAWDTRYGEIALLLQAADTAGAAERISSVMDDLSGTMDHVLYPLAQPAALRRTLALCESLRPASPSLDIRARCRAALRSLAG